MSAPRTTELERNRPGGPRVPSPVPVARSAGFEASAFRLGNRPALTGIRGIILSPVLIYHSNFTSLPGAWMTLGVFFVLSGFLITHLLAAEAHRTSRISLSAFYSRRMVRLIPPVVTVVAGLAVYALFVPVANAADRLWGDSLATLFYYADYRTALHHEPLFGFFGQSWSLSVEEQFYVLWSLSMIVAVRFNRRRVAYGICLVGMAASITDRVLIAVTPAHFTHEVFARIYYAFDTRADALLFGCLLGLLATDGVFERLRPTGRRVLDVAAVACCAGFGWGVATLPLWTKSLVLWWLPLSTVMAGVVIVSVVVNRESVLTKVLEWRFLVYLGNLSYMAYVSHFAMWLIISPGTTHLPFWSVEMIRFASVFAFASASWYLIERPLTRWRRKSLDPGHVTSA